MLALDDHPVGSLPDDAKVVILVHSNGTASAQLVHVHSGHLWVLCLARSLALRKQQTLSEIVIINYLKQQL